MAMVPPKSLLIGTCCLLVLLIGILLPSLVWYIGLWHQWTFLGIPSQASDNPQDDSFELGTFKNAYIFRLGLFCVVTRIFLGGHIWKRLTQHHHPSLTESGTPFKRNFVWKKTFLLRDVRFLSALEILPWWHWQLFRNARQHLWN